MFTMAQSAANLPKRHTLSHVDHTHSPTHLRQHSYNHWRCAKLQLSGYRIWNRVFILKVPEGGGANLRPRRKPPTACPLIGVTYQRRKSNVPDGELNPHPPTLVISLTTWPRARAASDPLCYRPPLLNTDFFNGKEGSEMLTLINWWFCFQNASLILYHFFFNDMWITICLAPP